jgi:RND family efflux transporter MFP subunit
MMTMKASLPSKLIRILLPIIILAIGGFFYIKLSVKEDPKNEKKEWKPNRTKTRVEVLQPQDFTAIIKTQGIVRAHNEVSLTPRVAGTIQNILPGFEPGAFFAKDEVLVELDDVDFQTAVLSAKAQVARAKATLAFEQTRAEQAKLNWQDLGFDEEPNELVLRLPQLREAEANVASAEAQLEQAQRNLERTRIRAPFDGRVLERNIGIAQSVGPGTSLGMIFATDFAEIDLPLSSKDIEFVDLPESSEDPPLDVVLRDAIHDSEVEWNAKIIRTKGALDPSSLELFAIARIQDPFGRLSNKAPLRIGQPVVASISGKVLKGIYLIPREIIRNRDRILLVDPKEFTLDQRNINPIWSTETQLIIRDDTIKPGTLLALSPIPYPSIGSKVEIKEDPPEETKPKPEGTNQPHHHKKRRHH